MPDEGSVQQMTEPREENHYEPYEVFMQRDSLAHHVHVGSVIAPTAELALHVARESFLRRDTAISLWVVKQTEVHQTSYEDKDFFANQEIGKSYREVSGYADNAKRWKRFKEQAMTIDDIVHDVQGG